jgi:hypothetical protein
VSSQCRLLMPVSPVGVLSCAQRCRTTLLWHWDRLEGADCSVRKLSPTRQAAVSREARTS